MPTIEEVRALAFKHRAELRRIFWETVDPPKMSASEWMRQVIDDDFTEDEIKAHQTAWYEQQRQRLKAGETPDLPSFQVSPALRMIMQLTSAANGHDRPEDRDALLTVGWRYLQMLEDR
jgi:hypothetical protein